MIHFLLLGKAIIFSHIIQQYLDDLKYKILINTAIGEYFSIFIYGFVHYDVHIDQYFKYLSPELIEVCSLPSYVDVAYVDYQAIESCKLGQLCYRNISCLHVNLTSHSVTMMSDEYGTNPIWQAFGSNDFIFTTDIIMFHMLSFRYPMVSIGQSVVNIDVASKSVNIIRSRGNCNGNPIHSDYNYEQKVFNLFENAIIDTGAFGYFERVAGDSMNELVACFLSRNDKIFAIDMKDASAHRGGTIPVWYRIIMDSDEVNDSSYLYLQPMRYM